jgi:hypothetical protein
MGSHRGGFPAAKWMIAMRNQFGTRLRHGLAACICGALFALGSTGALKAQQAQDDDDDTFEQRIIKGILGGLGVNVGGGKGIDYRERSPLVIPPSLDLPPPVSADAAATNPSWPREQTRKKAAARSVQNTLATAEDPGSSSRMTPQELRRGANPNAQRVTDPSHSGSQEEVDVGRPLRPRELGNNESIFNWRALTGNYGTETARFEGEGPRRSLTDPPTGYQTPSSSFPYGVGVDTPTGWKVPTLLDRPVGPNDGKDY